ncbi:MAG TPA: ThiF family adenylyltransferase [Candidatus Paceibacterota bacterium]|nr:ThiF family adenylyltransferase [Candidatus Paceibacterota bacterium]
MPLDPLRHLDVFKPHAFGGRRVDVIGCGATGSRIALSLAKLGVEVIHVWDFDKVEEHNLANQGFGLEDVGELKTTALARLVKRDAGVRIETHAERVDGSQPLGDVVFLLTDTMASRKEIWDRGLKFKLRTKLLVETRMGADSGRVYALNPNTPLHTREWEKTLYTDEEAEVSACGTSVSVGPTAEIISGLAVWQMLRWFAVEQGGEDELDNEIIFSLRAMTMLNRRFKA